MKKSALGFESISAMKHPQVIFRGHKVASIEDEFDAFGKAHIVLLEALLMTPYQKEVKRQVRINDPDKLYDAVIGKSICWRTIQDNFVLYAELFPHVDHNHQNLNFGSYGR